MFPSMETRRQSLPPSALVTGASRGLGLALAQRLARAGTRVALVARSAEPLALAVAGIRAAGGTAFALAYDVADKRSAHVIAAAAAELVGPIDLLVHNASSLGPVPLRPLLDTDCEDFERALAVNLVGPFRLTKAIAGSMALRSMGTIVHISSDAAVNAYANWGAYSASKAALDHLTRLLAAELGPHGVRVIGIDPSDMATELHAAAMPDADRAGLSSPDEIAARIIDMLTHPDVQNGQRVEAATWRVEP